MHFFLLCNIVSYKDGILIFSPTFSCYLYYFCRTIVGSTIISTPVIMIVYVLTNTAFFAVLSYDEILSSTAVGLVSRKECK